MCIFLLTAVTDKQELFGYRIRVLWCYTIQMDKISGTITLD